MWIAEQLNSFINLGICKEYPIMARSKSTSGGKNARSNPDANRANPQDKALADKARSNVDIKEQTSVVSPANLPDVKAVAAEIAPPAPQFETKFKTKPENKITEKKAAENQATPEPRRLEVAKPDVTKAEPRKNLVPINLVPINLDEEIRRRAYELYQQRGNAFGSETEDWLAAESEVLRRYHQRSA
jgi:hypothetical protein